MMEDRIKRSKFITRVARVSQAPLVSVEGVSCRSDRAVRREVCSVITRGCY